jgi:hypothetical protein
VNSPPSKPEVILTNFFAEPTVLLVPITSRAMCILFYQHYNLKTLFLDIIIHSLEENQSSSYLFGLPSFINEKAVGFRNNYK